MQMHTLPIKCFWIVCRTDEDYNQEYGAGQFDEAVGYLNSMREVYPEHEFEMISEIDA